MELRWSLNELYTSFEDDAFLNDLKMCDLHIQRINAWVAEELTDTENAASKMEQFLHLYEEFHNLFSKLRGFTHLSLSVDVKNQNASKALEILQAKISELKESTVKFQKWLSSIENLEEIISSSDLLKTYRFYLQEIVKNNHYLLSEKEERIISRMSNTGSKAWTKLQQLLTSTLLVDIKVKNRKKTLPLSVVRNMAFDKDPKIRKTAYEAELNSYYKIEESSAACLNGIKGEVLTLCGMRGYESPLEETLIKSRMDFKTLEAMLSAIRESLPIFHQYYRRKGELLGYKNGLPYYEMFAPMGKMNKKYTYKQAKNFIVKNFRTFSNELANLAEEAFTKGWIDAEPREGKNGGAFCYGLHPIKQSRILTNFTGSFKDVKTLAHELGHAYHNYCLAAEAPFNTSYPLPMAETASIFAETIITNAALEKANEEEAFGILESSISSASYVVVDIYSRYLFEKELFERRKNSSLSVQELNSIMLEAQQNAFGNGLDHDYLHPYAWINKPHYYYPESNFYNFPYTFGLLFSLGLYGEYLKRGKDFVQYYHQLLASTGKANISDIGKMAGIDVTSIEFWRSSLQLIEDDIKKFVIISSSMSQKK